MSQLEVAIPESERASRFKSFKENLELTVKANNENVFYNIYNLTESTTNNLNTRDVAEAGTLTLSIPSNTIQQQGLNAFSHIPNAEFMSSYTGAMASEYIPVAIAAVAGGLSVAAIAGIAAGGTIAVATAVGTTVAVIKYKKNKKHAEEESKPAEVVEMKPKGMDMFNFDPKTSHQSITARAVPMN
eukprot:gene1296-1637_t